MRTVRTEDNDQETFVAALRLLQETPAYVPARRHAGTGLLIVLLVLQVPWAIPASAQTTSVTLSSGQSYNQSSSTNLTVNVGTAGDTQSIALSGIGSVGATPPSPSIAYSCQNSSGDTVSLSSTTCTQTTDSSNQVTGCTANSGYSCVEHVTGGTFTGCVDGSGNTVSGCTITNNSAQCAAPSGDYCTVMSSSSTTGGSGTSGPALTVNVSPGGAANTVNGIGPNKFGIGVSSQGNFGGGGGGGGLWFDAGNGGLAPVAAMRLPRSTATT